jgi:hypothetical protein
MENNASDKNEVFEMVPERRVGVVVLTNMRGQPAGDLAREILKILI